MKVSKDDTERYTMFLEWKIQYYQNYYTTRAINRLPINRAINIVPTKSPMASFTESQQKSLQFVWKHKRP